MKAVFHAGTDRSPFARYIVGFPAGATIFAEGEIGTEMFTIQSGTVEIVKTIGGEARVLSTLEKGDFFGEMSILEGVPRPATARAKTSVELVRINGAMFDAMLKSNTEIAVRMLRKLSRRLNAVTGMLEQALGRQVEDVQRPVSRPAAAERHVCRLVSADGTSEFFLNREGDTFVGRADPVTGIVPDVDLTPLDPERSISRQHARIYPIAGSFYLMEEIGVGNGTFVNDVRLTTGSPVAIHNGDDLKFGLVPLTFADPSA